MKTAIMLLFFIPGILTIARSQVNGYNTYPVYKGKDLGLVYSPLQSSFRIWAPTAMNVDLLLYKEGEGGTPEKIPMKQAGLGTWVVTVKKNLAGRFYTFQAGRVEQGGLLFLLPRSPIPMQKRWA